MPNLETYLQNHPVRKYEKDQVILCQDDVPTEIYAVKSGYIKGYDINIGGSEQLVWLGSAGDIFPYDWLFSAVETSQLFYGAFSTVEVYIIDKKEFIDYLSDHPTILLEVTRKMATTFNDLMVKLAAAEKPKANQKIVHVLNMLAQKYSTELAGGEGRALEVPLTQQDLANLVGLTRETVAAELKKLRTGGYVEYDKLRFVVKHERLTELL